MNHAKQQCRKLRFPSPRREAVELGVDRWHSQPWTLAGVLSARRAGMWFEEGRHDFASQAARDAALGE